MDIMEEERLMKGEDAPTVENSIRRGKPIPNEEDCVKRGLTGVGRG